MTQILPWQPNETCEFVIRQLAEGNCVALPTESTYEVVASASCPEAVASLAAEPQPAIVLGDFPNLHDWLPLLRGAGPRLFRKLGAGPFLLCADGGFRQGAWSRLPESSQRLLVRDGQIAIRWPEHAIWDELRVANLPLV